MIFEQVTILGVGLIGGSLAGAMRKKRVAERIIGWGRTEENLKIAMNKGLIDRYFMKASEAIKGAEAVIISVHLDLYSEIFSLLKWEGYKGIISEVGSVKKRILESARSYNFFHGMFVPSHPVAGKEKGSVKNAEPELFIGAKCIVTPYDGINYDALAKVKNMWTEVGAKVIEMDAETHDRILSCVSHLPHITAYITYMLAKKKGYTEYSGGSFKDITRVAKSSTEMWSQIFLWNKEEVLKTLNEFEGYIKRFKNLLESGNRDELLSYIKEGEKN